MGNKIIEIHRISYLKPKIKDGNRSEAERSTGLKEINVASLKKVKIRIKIMNRLMTHKMVFGIFKRSNM
jgi:hypothetical protein